jgi:GH15 family glucan-1,4-alpha-glucosidase
LVSQDGSIDWCCFHRFDARPVFSRLLDWSGGGHFRVAPTGPSTPSRRYLPATNVLETRYVTPTGVLTVVDCLAIRRGAAAGDAAQTRSHHQLLRLVRCEAGQVEVAVEFAPLRLRPDHPIRLARALGLPADLDRWTALRRAIRRRVEGAGVDPVTGAFTQAFGSPALDAANLLLPLVGFLPPDDPRIRATVERTARELAPHGLVHRYLGADDGLPGGEASFVICSFWLVDNLALAGQTDHATALFERLLGHANDLGLLAEQIDPASGQLLGNFPQAFRHVGLISAAINLQRGHRTPHRAASG